MVTQQNRQYDELDILAKQVAGPNVRVKDPELFSTVLNQSFLEYQQQTAPITTPTTLEPTTGSISVSPSPLPVEEPLAPFIGQGGLLDPEKLKSFALGFPEMASYLNPYPVGPAASAALKAGRTAMPKSVLGKLGSVPLWGMEKITAPITTGPFQKRLAKEAAVAVPFGTTLEGVAKRKEEGIAAPWENTATAMLTSLGILITPQAARGVTKVAGKNLAKSFQPEVAFAKTDEPIDDILQNEVFKSHYELISPSQRKFVDNYITNNTKTTALTERQKEFLFEKLLKTYNRNKIIKTVESLPDTDPKKQQVQKVVQTLDDAQEVKPKPLEIEYEEKVNPTLKGKLARVFEHNGRVHRIFTPIQKRVPQIYCRKDSKD